MENENRIPELSEAYLRANVPYRSKVRSSQQLYALAILLGLALVLAAVHEPHLFAFPPMLLDLACEGVPRCAGLVEQLLLEGWSSSALHAQRAYAIGAMGFLLCMLSTLPLVAAYYRYCLSICSLTHRRRIQIAQNLESVSDSEEKTLRLNSGPYNLMLLVLSVALMLAFYCEFGNSIVGLLVEYTRNKVVIALPALGLYAMLFNSLLFSIRTFACLRSL